MDIGFSDILSERFERFRPFNYVGQWSRTLEIRLLPYAAENHSAFRSSFRTHPVLC